MSSNQVPPAHHHHHRHHHRHGEVAPDQQMIDPLPLEPVHANRIGKYQIVKTLGEGSFGKVKLAYHTTTGQRVALKIINRKTLAKSDMQGRIEREISYLRLLNHPHIIKLYDVIESKDEIIMVIEYAGKELFEYIVQHGRMSDSDARRFFQQIIAAMDYCHRHKIVHRDLKPENLLLDDNLNIKIADFGLSNIMSDGNFLKTSCGSPNYAAPEVISGKLYAGPEVDVWSCGVILYVMLCGRLPFDDELIPALFKKISNGVYTIPHDLSPGAKNLLTRMLVVNPLNRITVQEILDDSWFKVDFPDYLKRQDDDSQHDVTIDDVDSDVVAALSSAMGYSEHEILEAIKIGRKPETEEILDSYELMRNNRVLVDDIKRQSQESSELPQQQQQPQAPPPQQQQQQQHLAGNRGDWRTPMQQGSVSSGGYAPQSNIAVLPSSLPQIHRAYMVQMHPELASIQPITTKKSKTRWHFGIRSRSYPLDVMGEIYRALRNLNAEWQRPSEEELWTIKVRWKYSPNDIGVDSTQKKIPDMMKLQIQLFQLEPNNYLVDFKFDGWDNADGSEVENVGIPDDDAVSSFSAYPFLHLCTRLIMELAVNSQG
ncbi:DEKNAAC105384 [Brettanomyces naardenensis]|uniref:Carbon catabolite-derepressing protein kinase n=1 Tax=Brettanomyces naardenensis TaxID=13370 RepID=A0A448YTH4_BRENA|nr:DEKNAAC105384 [Brettanomyces naardenensis]